MSEVSVCMIVKNEEQVLARCLQSLGDFPDELIIVDTGSTDKTVEIATNFGAKVFHFDWVDDFSKARNYSFEQATKPYIMWLDADDVILPQDLQKLKDLKPNLSKDMYLMIYDYYQDQFGNPKSDLWRERIVRNTPELRFQYPIHECIPMTAKPDLTSKQCDIRITHKRTDDCIIADNGRNLRILEKACNSEEYRDDVRVRYYYGKELQDKGQAEEAAKHLHIVANSDQGWIEDKICAQFRIAQCYHSMSLQEESLVRKNGFRDEARRAAKKAIRMDDRWAEPYIVLGTLALDEQDWEEAAFWFETSLKPIPNVLSPIHTDNYTWLPRLQLVVCYGNLGQFDKAMQYNEEALKHNPTHPSLIHNKKWIQSQLDKKKIPDGVKKLNLGAGNKRYLDYTSCDLFPGSGVDEVFGLDNIPYQDNTIQSIHSEHALEHLRHTDARQAIVEWFRVLKPGGDVHLQLPDLELCCQKYVQAVRSGNKLEQEWYRYTLYGVQRSQGDEPAEGQIHYTGFNKQELVEEFEKAGFVIDYIGNYDGFSTPSIELRAVKPMSDRTITWTRQGDIVSPQYRIRTYHIDRWLRGQGYKSQIGSSNGDVVVFSDSSPLQEIEQARDNNPDSVLILNICEDTETFCSKEQMELEILRYKAVDMVVCCSNVLADKIRSYDSGIKTCVIEDAVEIDFRLNCEYDRKTQLTIGWIGMGGNVVHAEELRSTIESLGHKLVTIHEHDNADIKWDINTWQHDLAQCDIAIAPIDYEAQPSKSSNKIATYMALGLPVIASPLDAYNRVIQNGHNGFIADSTSEWRHYLILLSNSDLRRQIGEAGKETARQQFHIDVIGKRWADIIDGNQSLATTSKPQAMVDIIIPTYNNDQYLNQCIDGIVECTDVPYNIIVVDAAGRDEQSIAVKGCQIIHPGRKTNFSESLNIGLQSSSAPFVCFLNDDTIVSRGWIKPLIESADQYGIANPLSNCDKGWLHDYNIAVADQQLLPGVHKIGDIDPKLIHDISLPFNRQYNRDWVAFFATVIKRQAIDSAGLMDEEFNTGSEDLDFCKRAAKQGYTCAINEKSFVFHYGGVSRKAHQQQDRNKHQKEDVENQSRISLKYDKPLVVLQTGYAYEQWDANILREKGGGGSETAACRMIEEFVKQGCRGVIFAPTGKEKQTINGVEWLDSSEWDRFIAMHHIDVCIISRYANFLETPIRADQKWMWIHDIWAMGTERGDNDLVRKHYDELTGIFCLSPWHRDFFAETHGIPKDKIVLTGNGADLSCFTKAELITMEENGGITAHQKSVNTSRS